MEEIRDIVGIIQKSCRNGGVEVSDVLAAFVARTVVEENANAFSLDKQVTEHIVARVVHAAVERLLLQNSVTLDTAKMQVDFDSSYVREDEALEKMRSARVRTLHEHKRVILELRPTDANDFETLTQIYRKIFRYLLEFYPSTAPPGTVAEREVAAALESVFPRIGLKAFAHLSSKEQSTQLKELATIVLGIRLFNKEHGRGGAGIDNVHDNVRSTVNELQQKLIEDEQHTSKVIGMYQNALVRAHRKRRSSKADTRSMGLHDVASDLPLLDRWAEELANRRQYSSFLRTLLEDVQHVQNTVSHASERFRIEMSAVTALVGSKAAVPKDQVYPKFDKIAKLWMEMWHEMMLAKARARTYTCLCKCTEGFKSTMPDLLMLEDVPEGQAAEVVVFTEEERDLMPTEPPMVQGQEDYEQEGGPRLLLVDSRPEFMQLPLHFQGFCCWTLVKARGLLVSGRPSLGVVQYGNAYYVFAHQEGLAEFMRDPEHFIEGVKQRAISNPEYIHLLRLQHFFPGASIARLVQNRDADGRSADASSKADAFTETPLHFTQKRIERSYHWNEWELRRRALQAVNLHNCKTTSQQTDASHFRRDSETQVYLQHESSTQTSRSCGTNPPHDITFLAGLRGEMGDLNSTSRYTDRHLQMNDAQAQPKTAVLGRHPLAAGGEKSLVKRTASIIRLTLDV